MRRPTVSIIVPNYNHARFLQQRLDSIFNQTFQDFEVILLDDASTDESVAILENYRNHPKVSHIIVNRENLGSPFKQWQRGIELAKGEYIWIAESDDYSNVNFLEIIMHLFNQNPSLGLGYCQTIDVDERGNILHNRTQYTAQFQPNIWKNDFIMNGKEFIGKYLSVINVIPNASAVVFKKELLENYFFSNLFIKMKMCGDWLFWIQLCLTIKLGFVSETFNFFRQHQDVSRLHTTKEKKKRRLQEEAILRRYIYSRLSISNLTVENNMCKKWFALHSSKALLTTNFYSLQLPSKNRLIFILDFLKFQIKTVK